MKRYPVSKARERIADVLDEVERTGAAMIERGGVQYVISVRRPVRRAKTRRPMIEILDPSVEAGEWHWQWSARGLRLETPRRRRR